MITYSLQVEYKFPVVAFSNPMRGKLELGFRSALEIKRAVTRAFGVSMAELEGPQRHRYIVLPPFAAYRLIYCQGRSSTPQIGRYMGGRDHATVINGIRRCKEFLASDPEFAARYEEARG